jgi:hypothetical protein
MGIDRSNYSVSSQQALFLNNWNENCNQNDLSEVIPNSYLDGGQSIGMDLRMITSQSPNISQHHYQNNYQQTSYWN